MRSSEQINELAAALAKAQGQMKAAKKSEDNPYYRSKYADLANVVENSRQALAANGLAIVQGANTVFGPPGSESAAMAVGVTTRLIHTSGQWIEDTLFAIPKDFGPQNVGGLVTYLRRYGRMAIVGETAEGEDDDGEFAEGRGDKTRVEKSAPPRAPDITDAVEDEKKYLRRAFKTVKKYLHVMPLQEGVTLEARIKQMDAEVAKNKDNLPSLRYIIKRYQDELEPYVKQAHGEAYKEWAAEFNARVESDGTEF